IIAEDVEGWQVANLGKLTVALDINISKELKQEGVARELINRIQNLRKNKGFEVTDKIIVKIVGEKEFSEAVENNLTYICNEILASDILFVDALTSGEDVIVEEKK